MDAPIVLEEGACRAEITPRPLDLAAAAAWVADPAAGAVATFSGVTRGSFGGRAVLRLEYEAYGPMAAASLLAVCAAAAARTGARRVAAAHRTGAVAVGEASVVIAASSAHRAAALQAVHWAIDELKAVVPVWKKEFYEGGAVWKENAESRARLLGEPAAAGAVPGGDGGGGGGA